MHELLICALGPDDPQLLTRAADQALTGELPLLLRTRRHGVAGYLHARAKAFDTLDALYTACEDFDELCARAREEIIAFARAYDRCVYGVSDPLSDETVRALCDGLPDDIRVSVVPGVTLTDTALAASLHAGVSTRDARTLCVLSLEQAQCDPSVALVITEIDTRVLAGEAKLFLMRMYPDEMEVYLLAHGARTAVPIALCEADRQPGAYGHTCALIVPPVPMAGRERFCLADLEEIMRRLRAPDGCPWDREQTHASLRPFLVEEAWEACEAIDEQDADKLCDELGDVLFQVAFHAEIATEHAAFDLQDVISAICQKMIERHAHVFAGKHYASMEEINRNWERLKRAQRGEKSTTQAMRDISRALPALMRAQKALYKAKAAGCDVLEIPQGADAQSRVGHALLAAVRDALLQGVDAEQALGEALTRYIARFEQWEREP